jgi:hypothetical protein
MDSTPALSFWDRLKRTKVVQWGLVYLTVGATLFQVADIAAGTWELGPAFTKATAAILILGFFPCLLLAWYHGDRELKRVTGAELILIAAVLAVGSGVLWSMSQSRDLRAASNAQGETVTVLAVMSGAPPYEELILESFHRDLEAGLNAAGRKLDWKVPLRGSADSPDDAKGRAEWDTWSNNIKQIYASSHLSYLVTVGSYASTALHDRDTARVAKGGQFFLGVTDPIQTSKLVSGFGAKRKEGNITGVRYGTGGEAFGRCVAALFPENQALVFVHDQSSVQDKYMSVAFSSLRSSRDIHIDELALTQPLRLSDLSDQDAIYFSWYSFDNMLADVGNPVIADLHERKVVPSTYTPENLEYAGVIVSVDDGSVGIKGAELMLRAVLGPVALGDLPVESVPFLYWVNKETAFRKKIGFAPKIYDQSSNGPFDCANLTP